MELKDTIQKLVESHLAEKKKMLAKFEQETHNYSEYYRFFHDNKDKIEELTKQVNEFSKERKIMEDRMEELKLQSENPTEISENFLKF